MRIVAFTVVFALVSFLVLSQRRGDSRSYLAAFFFPERVPSERLADRYRQKQLTVLIVPGHDRDSWGTSFGDLKEVELTVALAEYLDTFFKTDDHFRVFLAQDTSGYTPWVTSHAAAHAGAIQTFRDRMKQVMIGALQSGFEQRTLVYHPTAEPEVAARLYGLNEWANESGVDLVIHVHFNDYAGRRLSRAGTYTGLAIYVPERQLPNARASVAIARSVLARLITLEPVSNLPQEADGIIEDQELIAIGANASLDPPALLIEYGYIYEPQWTNTGVREAALRELAYRTYAGVVQHFDPDRTRAPHDAAILPHHWEKPLTVGLRNSADVFALQLALQQEGLYPPIPSDLRRCPLSGSYFECTETAVGRFQAKYRDEILTPAGLTRPSGTAGSRTLQKLNELYGLRSE